MEIKINKQIFEKEFNDVKTRLLADLDFHQYIRSKHISAKQFDANLYTFKDIYDAMAKCKNCKGLYMCSQASTGILPSIENYNGALVETRCSCKYLKEKNLKESYLNNFKVNDIELPHKSLSFNEIDPSNETDLYKLLFINLYKNKNSKTGIYLYGNMGVGKSYLMSSYFNDLAREGHKVAYVRVSEFLSKMNVYYSYKDKSEFNLELTRLKEAEYLCLDDIGAEMVNEVTRDLILFPILDYRMSNELPTYFISNVSINALKERYANTYNKDIIKADRLVERIKKLAKPFELDGIDKRLMED